MNYFFYQLSRSIGVFFRTLKAFLTRKIMGVGAYVRRVTNFSRHATKAASASLQGVVSAAQNPTGPSDYVETERLYISKALIVRVFLGLAAAALVAYFLVWPFVLSHFLTARFYERDKRVPDWSGRVIVYADEKKTLPRYSGRLEDGVLQGEGKQFDGEGVPVYEGQFRDGQRSGNGKEYAGGVLLYEGQFSDGVYNGRGKLYADGQLVYDGQYVEGKRSGSGTAYKDGKLLYEGQFLDDLYEGRGRLYEDGVLCYDGAFHAGTAEGAGTAYYPSGQVSYQGQFLAGKRDGAGTAYGTDGAKVYAGDFAADAYSGTGTLFFADGGQLTAAFQDGKPEGSVEWKKNGIPYYRGEWSDGAASGFGTLYGKDGKRLYEGAFLGGTIDGRALLNGTAEELRAALGEGSVRNENDSAGYRIVAEELGLTALCTFQTEAEDSRPYQIYLSAPEKDGWIDILPGGEHIPAASWPEGMTPERLSIQYAAQLGVTVESGAYFAENAMEDAWRFTVLYSDEKCENAVLLTWERTDLTPAPTAARGTGGAADSKVEALLGALDLMQGTAGAGAGGSAGAVSGGKSVDEALTKAADIASAVNLTDAMLGFWEETELLRALQEASERTDILLADAQDALAKGVGSTELVEALQRTQLEQKAQIEAAKTAVKRAELQASTSGVTGLGDYALEELLVSFDPGEQEVGELALIAAAYAQATGGEMTADAAETAVKTGLLDLTDARSAVQLALTRYQSAEASAQSAAGAYAMSLGSKEAWYGAMNDQALARAGLCTALAGFSRQANQFNQLTGGWISRTFDWHKDVFEPMFRAALQTEDDAAA